MAHLSRTGTYRNICIFKNAFCSFKGALKLETPSFLLLPRCPLSVTPSITSLFIPLSLQSSWAFNTLSPASVCAFKMQVWFVIFCLYVYCSPWVWVCVLKGEHCNAQRAFVLLRLKHTQYAHRIIVSVFVFETETPSNTPAVCCSFSCCNSGNEVDGGDVFDLEITCLRSECCLQTGSETLLLHWFNHFFFRVLTFRQRRSLFADCFVFKLKSSYLSVGRNVTDEAVRCVRIDFVRRLIWEGSDFQTSA